MEDIAQGLRFEVDLSDGLVMRPQRAVLMRGDKSANKIVITVKDNGAPVDLTGVAVSGMFIRQSGLEVPLTGGVSGNVITVVLNDHCYVESGHYEAFVRVKLGSALRTLLLIGGEVYKDGDGAVVDVEDVIPSIDDLLAMLDEMRQATEEANTAADAANNSAADAQNQARAAEAAARKLSSVGVSVTMLEPTEAASGTVTQTDSKTMFDLRVPRGKTGPQGPKGETGSINNLTINGKAPENGSVTLTPSDIGAVSSVDGKTGAVEVMPIRLYEANRDGNYIGMLSYVNTEADRQDVYGGIQPVVNRKPVGLLHIRNDGVGYLYDENISNMARIYTTRNPPPSVAAVNALMEGINDA